MAPEIQAVTVSAQITFAADAGASSRCRSQRRQRQRLSHEASFAAGQTLYNREAAAE